MHLDRVLWIAATWLLAAIAVNYCFLAAHMSLRTRAVLGPVTHEARQATQRLVEISREGARLVWTRTVLLYAGLGALVVALLAREWLGLFVAATPFALIWWMRVRTTTPPVVLLLGTSTHTTIKRQRALKRRVSPLRVVSLLDVGVPWDPDLAKEMSLDCFRTTNEDDWWVVIVRLIECSPVIVIDAAAETAGVIREGKHLLDSVLARKCLFITPPDDFAPILDRLLPDTKLERRDLRVVSYDEAPRAVAEMVAELTEARH